MMTMTKRELKVKIAHFESIKDRLRPSTLVRLIEYKRALNDPPIKTGGNGRRYVVRS